MKFHYIIYIINRFITQLYWQIRYQIFLNEIPRKREETKLKSIKFSCHCIKFLLQDRIRRLWSFTLSDDKTRYGLVNKGHTASLLEILAYPE